MKFEQLSALFEKLEGITSQTDMIHLLANTIRQAQPAEIQYLCYFVIGNTFPSYSPLNLGLGNKLIQQAISLAAGVDEQIVANTLKEVGDLGDTAAKLIENGKQFPDYFHSTELTVQQVSEGFHTIAEASGSGSQEVKVKTLTGMLASTGQKGKRYLPRLVEGSMRLGIGDMTVLNALSVAYFGDKSKKSILEHAYNISSDLGYVGKVLAEKGLEGVKRLKIQPNRPLKPMLAQRIDKLSDIPEKIESTHIAAEEKYDGERIQVHMTEQEVRLYSRRLTDVTNQFPEIVEFITDAVSAESTIIDGEAVAYNFDKQEYEPFQKLMQRRRKYSIEEYADKIPVVYMAFDLLYVDGESLIKTSYPKRIETLQEIVKEGKYIRLTQRIISEKLEAIDDFFQDCLERDLEGIICKSCADDAFYEAGARGWKWIKWKPSYADELSDTFDLVVVGAMAGKGKRRGTYGSLVCAAYNKDKDHFETVCKLGSGFTDDQLDKLPEKLQDYTTEKKPVRLVVSDDLEVDYWFTPSLVLEVLASEITRSSVHTCATKKGKGLSLRFPRFQRWRVDKKPTQATTSQEIKQMSTT